MEFLHPFRKSNQLSQVEVWKLQRHPLDVAEAVVTTYSKAGTSAIAEVEGEAERLKWVGLYPQRQGGDAFMLRLKVPGGQLSAKQAGVVAGIASRFARGPEENPVFGNCYADLTTRQDIQLHWIRIGDVPEIWHRLERVGMTTVQACGDSARNVLCCPVSGLDASEVFDAYPVAAQISSFFTGNREYANLPRKFKMSVTGCVEDCAQAEINDIGMLPARREDGTLGFNVLVGGGLSDGPRMASDIDCHVTPEQAVEITRAIAQVFGELGNRENRGLSRMRYLVQELGADGFRSELAKRASFELRPRGASLTRRYRGDHIGVHEQSQRGLYYVGLNVTVGRISAVHLAEAARLADTYGDGGIRLATDQNLILTGVPKDRLDELLSADLLRVLSPDPGPFERGAVACTGAEFCRFAIVETKARAAEWARHLDSKFKSSNGNGSEDSIVRMHFSGCSASCAQPQIADIGFRGETASKGDEIVEAVDIALGGSLGRDAAFADWVEGAKPVDEVPAAVDALVERFGAEASKGETFHEWARRTDNAVLRRTIQGAAP